jgi:Beta-lactamase enzyme family
MGSHDRRSESPGHQVGPWLVALLVGALAVGVVSVTFVHSRAEASDSSGQPSQAASPSEDTSAMATPRPAPPPITSAVSHHSPQSVTTAPAAAAASAAASAAVARLTEGLPAGGISVSELNLTTGASYQFGASAGMNTGSIVKLDILETLLLQDQDSGTVLSSSQVATATTMIENSNNDSAETLFEEIGGRPALLAANPRLGVSASTMPGPGDYWGLTTTDAADQIRLLKNLVIAGPLTAASQQFILGLMRGVEADQRWGVGVVADAGTTFANKNGWLAVDADNDLWLVNSLGIVTIKGQTVLMAVLTQHDASFNAGIALVQSLATAIAPAVVP